MHRKNDQRRSTTEASVFSCAAIFVISLIAWLVYSPGLGGNFLFDDFANLTALGSAGPIRDATSFFSYLTSGGADPLGRPLTLLTFLLDAQDWPADPYSFKRTNVLLHLINGLLLCWVLITLGRYSKLKPEHATRAAILGSAFWLLHPLFVSTTLYIVQREAMLPATFTFCGLIFWFSGRRALDEGKKISAWIQLACGALVCTLLAALCKANGLLLPLVLAVAEFTIGTDGNLSTAFKRQLKLARGVLLAGPILILLLVLASEVPTAITNAAQNRPWTIWQRLITEPRVISDYLRLLWIPRSTSFGVFNDQVQASANLLHPWSTIPCILFVSALIGLGWALRQRSKLLSFAILFYFSEQLLESTYIPLELAFEHRNYLPAAFLFWPFAAWLTDGDKTRWRSVFAVVLLVVLSGLTWSRCQVWGNLGEQALIWGQINPDSPRAQAFAAAIEMNYGHTPDAIRRLQSAASRMPDEIQITLNLAQAECRLGNLSTRTWQLVMHSLQFTKNGSRQIFDWFNNALTVARKGSCVGLDVDRVELALKAARMNTQFVSVPGRQQDFDHVEGLLALARNEPDLALLRFNKALVDNPDRGTALAQAAALGSAGYPALGLQHISFSELYAEYKRAPIGMPRIHEWVLERQHYWQNEFSHLKQVLSEDATNQ